MFFSRKKKPSNSKEGEERTNVVQDVETEDIDEM